MRIAMILAASLLAAGCVDHELRRASNLTAAEVQSFNIALVRFDQANHRVIAEIDASAAGNRAVAAALDDRVSARVTELAAAGEDDAVRLFQAAAPPVPAAVSELSPVTVPTWNASAQSDLLQALNRASARRTDGQSAELLLGFALDVAGAMNEPSEKSTDTAAR